MNKQVSQASIDRLNHNLQVKLQVKFCGLTRSQDVQSAVQLGADALGFVFYPPSPRAVTVEQAVTLAKQIPAFTTVVALVVNITEQELQNIAQNVPIDVVQFHGDETPTDCQTLANAVNKRWIKALRINAETDTLTSINEQIIAYKNAGASAILLDAYHKDKFGGTGERFDWSLIPTQSPLPVILAGGLTADNVADCVGLPIYAVDVSGGIEQEKGIKDRDKMAGFMQAINLGKSLKPVS